MLKNVFYRFAVLCLVMGALSFVGCGDGAGGGNLIGTWTSTFGESYTITTDTVTYDAGAMGAEFSYAGTIRNAPNFANPYGIIIIEYTQKPTYYDYGPAPDYAKTNPHIPVNNFQAIYWKDLTTASVGLAQTNEEEKATLSDATAAFTLDNESTYISYYGGYSK
ncbi:hypothetical protein AGMMS49587_11230 [Spirochaetia bacterium]|nr:hypothetical protein AGMMS49587_11230 [Spirochaetia bacterium]